MRAAARWHGTLAAAERGRGLEFLKEVSHLIWSGSVENWHEGDHLAIATGKAGLDFAELGRAVDGAPDRYRAIVERNQDEQRSAGHWGVPLMTFRGEPFFGQDRVYQFVGRLMQNGLTKRKEPRGPFTTQPKTWPSGL